MSLKRCQTQCKRRFRRHSVKDKEVKPQFKILTTKKILAKSFHHLPRKRTSTSLRRICATSMAIAVKQAKNKKDKSKTFENASADEMNRLLKNSYSLYSVEINIIILIKKQQMHIL